MDAATTAAEIPESPAPEAPPEPSPPDLTPTRAEGARLLELVAERADSHCDAELAWKVAAELTMAPQQSLEGVLEAVEAVAPRVGLQATRSDVSLQEVLEAAEDTGRALLLPALDKNGTISWFVPQTRSGNRVKGAWLSHRGENTRTLSLHALRLLLPPGSAPALTFEARFPLDALLRGSDSTREPVSRAWIRLWRFIALEGADLRLVLIYAVAIGFLSLLTPVAVQALVSSIAMSTLVQPLIVLSLALLGGLGLSAVLRGLRVYVVEMLARRVFVRVAADYARRIPNIDVRSRNDQNLPDLTLHFFDVLTLQKSGAGLLLDALGLVLQTAIGMVLLAFYHPYLLAFDVLLGFMLVAVVVGFFRRATLTALKESKSKYRVASWLQQLAAHPTTFSSRSTSRLAVQRSDSLVHNYLHARQDHFRAYMGIVVGGLSLQVLAPVALLVLGGMLVIQRELTLGQLVAAELVVAAIGVGFGKLGNHADKLFNVVAAMDKITKLVELPHRETGGEPVTKSGPATLRISGDKLGVIEVPAGSRAGLSGTPERVRKVFSALRGSDAMELAMVEVDGKHVRWVELDELRDVMWWLGPPKFFRASILDFLSLGPKKVDANAARRALAQVFLDPAELSDGLDTELHHDGRPLSPGEQRRLLLARALLHEPRVLFLDGALDDLELASEEREQIMATMLDADAPWTALVRSADPDVLERCTVHFQLEEAR